MLVRREVGGLGLTVELIRLPVGSNGCCRSRLRPVRLVEIGQGLRLRRVVGRVYPVRGRQGGVLHPSGLVREGLCPVVPRRVAGLPPLGRLWNSLLRQVPLWRVRCLLGVLWSRRLRAVVFLRVQEVGRWRLRRPVVVRRWSLLRPEVVRRWSLLRPDVVRCRRVVQSRGLVDLVVSFRCPW